MDANYDYQSMTKESLIEHCKAISFALHLLKQEAQAMTWRLNLIERNRDFFQKKEYAA